MPSLLPGPQTTHYLEIQQRWKELAAVANGIIPTRIPLEPRPSEIVAVRDDLEVLAKHVDALILAYGEYLNDNCPGTFDVSLFKDQLRGALDGNATHEIEEAASAVHERIMEAAA